MSSQTKVIYEIGTYTSSGMIIENDKSPKLLAKAIVPSYGIDSGVVKCVEDFVESTIKLTTKLENISNNHIKKVNLSITGCFIKSLYTQAKFNININNGEITKEDLQFFVNETLKKFHNSEYNNNIEILVYYPVAFFLDNNFVDKPIGMIGKELIVNLHIIVCDKNILNNMIGCLGRSYLAVEKVLPSILVKGYAFLTPEEMKSGTLLIDLGESAVTLGFFLDGNLCYMKTIDIGISLITENIFNGLNLASLNEARILQTKHAQAFDTSMTNGGELIYIDQNQPINSSELFVLVSDGLGKIFEKILNEIQENLDHKLIKRVYLVGGGANIPYINQYVAEFTGLNVRNIHLNNKSFLKNIPQEELLTFLSHYGFTKYLFEHEANKNFNNNKITNNIFDKIKSFFSS